MKAMQTHYESLLADHYTWLFGGMDAKCRENREFFKQAEIAPRLSGRAVDLGCGSGFQAIPLAEAGFPVTALDLSDKLLDELKRAGDGLDIRIIRDDLLNFRTHCPEPLELAVCMGDTLTHLESREKVIRLMKDVYVGLEPGGLFIITYRDLSHELKGTDRFISVNQDDDRIFTCFLEYEEDFVWIHDLIHIRENGGWTLRKSVYPKLRLAASWVKETLQASGFELALEKTERGFCTLIAGK